MVYRRFVVVGWLLAVACTQPQGLPEPAPTQPYFSPLGLAFDLPEGFTESEEGLAHIFSGPPNSNSYYTTVSLQMRGSPLRLDVALDDAFVELRDNDQFAWYAREPAFINDTPALVYGAQFEFTDMLHTEVGLLMVHDETLLDLSCLAPTELLEQAVPICETVLQSARFL